MKYTVLIPILSLVAIGAAAGDPTSGQSPAFESLDTNHDTMIDPGESRQMPALASTFSSADTNRDGNLDKQEFNKALAQIKQADVQSGQG
jgi:Ca2+-binding EF-hand superfamily protein